MSRRIFFAAVVALLVACAPAVDAAEVTVYKSPTCGCCKKWVDHLRAHGFSVKVVDVDDVAPYKKRHGVPNDLGSCHTATVAGYTIEGHVPARDIRRLLGERPRVSGLAVPNMPLGSPGMDDGPTKEPYDVIVFDKNGNRAVFARH